MSAVDHRLYIEVSSSDQAASPTGRTLLGM